MVNLITAAQMRATEQAAMTAGQVTGGELMERAGRGVVEAIFTTWPEWAPVAGAGGGPAPQAPRDISIQKKGAVVLCGPGNNGGDGFVVARLLAAAGWRVSVFLMGHPARLPADAAENYRRWAEIGPVAGLEAAAVARAVAEPGTVLAVDALFGTGLTRPFGAMGAIRAALGALRVVAVECVSGICADSGRWLGPGDPVQAVDLTVTFHCAKLGHALAQGLEVSGKLEVVDIGLAPEATGVRRAQVPVAALRKGGAGHKYRHGAALVLSGGVGRGGAARLAARGALRIGAGVVTVGCPPGALIEAAGALEAVMVRRVADEAELQAILQRDARITALCLGPGMGTGAREVALLRAALGSGRNLCLDADALTILATDPDLRAMLHPGCVLTPHLGEFARMFPQEAAALAAKADRGPAYSKVDAVRAAAAQVGCPVLLKGPDTVIAGPSGDVVILAEPAPWLATAGSGDVLAGFITGALARGFDPAQAAEVGAALHSACAQAFGPGLIAEDLPQALPGVMRALGV